jgi:MoxR-like ATPase
MTVEQRKTPDDLAAVEEVARAKRSIVAELGKVIVGQERVIEEILVALFAGGHGLLVGVPGLAKTLMINSLADILDLSFNRVQFTPDLMPSDITGTDILQEEAGTGHRTYQFLRGPVFTNILLADEINRTPPKTQAALLQAMQEYRVTAGGKTYDLDRPFFVLATQNPIEQEGTYPLPEAQLDRFMLQITLGYPSAEEEMRIVTRTTSAYVPDLGKVLSGERIGTLQGLVRRVPVSDSVAGYAVRLVQATRPANPDAPDFVRKWVSWGAGPRASQYLVLGGKARAILEGRYAVTLEDVRALAPAVLQHRVIPNFNAEAEGVGASGIVSQLLEKVPPGV